MKYRSSSRVLVALASVVLLAGCTAPGHAPTRQQNAAPAVSREGFFPPAAIDKYAYWVDTDDSFDLKLIPPKDGTPPPPKKLWVHKVTRVIPDTEDRGSWLEWARKAGIEAVKYEDLGGGEWKIRDSAPGPGDQGHGIRMSLDAEEMIYADSRVPNFEEQYKASLKRTAEEMDAIGVAKAKAMGFWPQGVNPTPLGIGIESTGAIGKTFTSASIGHYGGIVEGVPVEGAGQKLDIMTMSTGMIRLLRIRWSKSERFLEAECKTVEEAFDALNKGYSMGVPQGRFGTLAQYEGWTYYYGRGQNPFIHPMYKFRLKDNPKDSGWPCYVPAIKDKYFKDPKRQATMSATWMEMRKDWREQETKRADAAGAESKPRPAEPAR